MKFSFNAKIFKVGINPCVKVPLTITDKLVAVKGYIRIKGIIEGYKFKQTLIPVKNDAYRLYVNGPMVKGAKVSVGQNAYFTIQQNPQTKSEDEFMPKEFKKKLNENKLYEIFKKLSPYRQKEILRYLNYLKTEEAKTRNMDKFILELKKHQMI